MLMLLSVLYMLVVVVVVRVVVRQCSVWGCRAPTGGGQPAGQQHQALHPQGSARPRPASVWLWGCWQGGPAVLCGPPAAARQAGGGVAAAVPAVLADKGWCTAHAEGCVQICMQSSGCARRGWGLTGAQGCSGESVYSVCVCVSVEVFLGGWVGVLCAVDEGKGVRCIHTVSRCHAAFGICELRGVEVCC